MNNLYFPVMFGVLAVYLLAFSYETILSWRRLRRPAAGRAGYVDVTWEITHTLLVFAFTLFMITYSQALPEIAPTIFLPVLLSGVTLGLRAALYLYIFYIRSPRHRSGLADYLFALTHLLIIGSIVTSVIAGIMKIQSLGASPNLAYFGSLLPGLFVTLIICSWPLWRLYHRS